MKILWRGILVLLLTESDDEYSDDDDMSWKVRRSAIKCLEALICTRRDLLLSFYSSICPALLARFKEREENVKADVFAAFSTLLRQTRGGSSHHSLITASSEPGTSQEEEPAVALLKKEVLKTDVNTWGQKKKIKPPKLNLLLLHETLLKLKFPYFYWNLDTALIFLKLRSTNVFLLYVKSGQECFSSPLFYTILIWCVWCRKAQT